MKHYEAPVLNVVELSIKETITANGVFDATTGITTYELNSADPAETES